MPLDLRKLTVLIAEDNPDILKIIRDILQVAGVEKIYTAKNGRQAFDRFLEESPDIVFTDWEMTPVDGLELIRMIRESRHPNSTLPIIMVSGYGAPQRVLNARDHGITEFLVKPFTADQLLKRLTYVINQPREFVEAPSFIGPSRRRRAADDYSGVDRRGQVEVWTIEDE